MTENLRKYFIRYTLELVVIFTGITLSFAFDHWRNARTRTAEERELLGALSADLLAIEQQLKADSLLVSTIKQLSAVLVDERMQNQIDKSQLRSIVSDLSVGSVYFQPTCPSYEIMKSTGKLTLISNDSLRLGLVQLMETRFVSLQYNYQEAHDFIRRAFSKSSISLMPQSTNGWTETWRQNTLRAFRQPELGQNMVGLGMTANRLDFEIRSTLNDIRLIQTKLTAHRQGL
jgi:hypothetical protein